MTAFILVSNCQWKTDSSKELSLISIELFIPDRVVAAISSMQRSRPEIHICFG